MVSLSNIDFRLHLLWSLPHSSVFQFFALSCHRLISMIIIIIIARSNYSLKPMMLAVENHDKVLFYISRVVFAIEEWNEGNLISLTDTFGSDDEM